jgi:hypothetical protein
MLPFANFVIDAESVRAMLSAVASNGIEKTLTQNIMKNVLENILTTFAICLPLAFVAIVILSLPR